MKKFSIILAIIKIPIIFLSWLYSYNGSIVPPRSELQKLAIFIIHIYIITLIEIFISFIIIKLTNKKDNKIKINKQILNPIITTGVDIVIVYLLIFIL